MRTALLFLLLAGSVLAASPGQAVIKFNGSSSQALFGDGQWKNLTVTANTSAGSLVVEQEYPGAVIANTATEGDLAVATLPPGSFGATRWVQIRLACSYQSGATVDGETGTVRVYENGTLAATERLTITAPTSDESYVLIVLDGAASGSDTSQVWRSVIDVQGRVDQVKDQIVTGMTDSVTNNVSITWQWSAASPTNTVTSRSLTACVYGGAEWTGTSGSVTPTDQLVTMQGTDGSFVNGVQTPQVGTTFTISSSTVVPSSPALISGGYVSRSSNQLVYAVETGPYLYCYESSSWTAHQIPSAGVTLNCSPLNPSPGNSTDFNVYGYMSGGSMLLEASTTATTTQDGVWVKDGATDHTLLAIGRTNASGGVDCWNESAEGSNSRFQMLCNRFNRRLVGVRYASLDDGTCYGLSSSSDWAQYPGSSAKGNPTGIAAAQLEVVRIEPDAVSVMVNGSVSKTGPLNGRWNAGFGLNTTATATEWGDVSVPNIAVTYYWEALTVAHCNRSQALPFGYSYLSGMYRNVQGAESACVVGFEMYLLGRF